MQQSLVSDPYIVKCSGLSVVQHVPAECHEYVVTPQSGIQMEPPVVI